MSNKQVYLADTKVGERYGVTRATPWRWSKEGTFPQPVKLSPGCTRWLLSEIEAWEQSLKTAEAQPSRKQTTTAGGAR